MQQRQLGRLVESLESTQRRLHRLVDTIPETSWSARPDADRWSIAECVGHLNLTSEAMIPRMRAALAQTALLPAAPLNATYRHTLLGALMAAALGPVIEIGRLRLFRVPTGTAFVPGADAPRSATMDTFDRLQAEFIGLVRESNGRRIDQALVPSPFNAQVSYNLYSALVITARHEVRHVVQAERTWRDLQPSSQ